MIRDYYRGFADMLFEILASLRLSPQELARRVKLVEPERIRDEIGKGRPVLLLAALIGAIVLSRGDESAETTEAARRGGR